MDGKRIAALIEQLDDDDFKKREQAFRELAGFGAFGAALLADAAHMLTDVGGLGLALFAAWMSSKPATPARTYGYYRVEILAAMINAGVLLTGELRHTRLPRVQGRVEEIVSAVPSSSRWNALKRHRRVGPRPVGQ